MQKDFAGAFKTHQDMDAVMESCKCGKCKRFCERIKGASGYGCSIRKTVFEKNANDFVSALKAHQDMDAVTESCNCGKCKRFCGRIQGASGYGCSIRKTVKRGKMQMIL